MHKITIKYFPVNPCEGVSVVFTFCQSWVYWKLCHVINNFKYEMEDKQSPEKTALLITK